MLRSALEIDASCHRRGLPPGIPPSNSRRHPTRKRAGAPRRASLEDAHLSSFPNPRARPGRSAHHRLGRRFQLATSSTSTVTGSSEVRLRGPATYGQLQARTRGFRCVLRSLGLVLSVWHVLRLPIFTPNRRSIQWPQCVGTLRVRVRLGAQVYERTTRLPTLHFILSWDAR